MAHRITAALLLCLSGCLFKADPIPATPFLAGPEKLELHRERFPFHEVWISPEYVKERNRFDSIVVPPVHLEFLLTTGDWEHIKVLSDEQIREEAQELGDYLHESFREAFLSAENNRIALVEEPGFNTLLLEIAIVELIPTDVARSAAGDVVGFLVPGGGLVAAGAGGSIAVEAKLRDARTGKLLGKFKDHEQAKIRPIDLEGLTPYGFAEEAIDEWAYQTMLLFNTPPTQQIEDSSAVSLSPW